MINVQYSREQAKLTISVNDTGKGISREEMPGIFNRFGKMKRTAKQNSEGLGLGLVIVKQIVDQYNGEVSVHSDGLGRGSTFVVTLFIRPAQNESLESSSFSRIRLLIE